MSRLDTNLLAVVLVGAFLSGGCKDVERPDGTGGIAVRIVVPSESGAWVSTGAVAGPMTHLEAARATATSSNTTKTVQLTRSGNNFTGTIDQLPVGTYTVTVEGLVGGEVDHFGQTSGVEVRSGQNTTATISFASFVPSVSLSGPSPTSSFSPTFTIQSVPGATSYIVEVDRTTAFSNPFRGTVNTTNIFVTVTDTGTFYVRARAVNSAVSQGGRAGAPVSARVVTDLRPSGDTFSTATDLGFGSSSGFTLDSLNIYPATDSDWFQLKDCNGDSLTITAQAVRLAPRSPLNSFLQLFSGSTGRFLAENDDLASDTTDARIKIAISADGNYRIRVFGSNNTVGHYKLVIQVKAGANNTGSGCKVAPFSVPQLSAGRYHTCAVKGDGTVACWGRNEFGELGNGTSGNAFSSPVRVSSSESFQTVAAGGLHSCALTVTGVAYCWGRNGNGQLGDGSSIDRTTPVAVSGSRTYQKITAGRFHTCALDTGGTAYCWGSNFNGKLGDGTSTSSSTPVAVSGGLTFQQIGAGEQHTCGLTTAGEVYCWGDNSSGQLGDGTNTGSAVPVPVGSSFTALAVGGFHTCALTTSGVAKCWGHGGFGQLGNGAFANSNVPVSVSGSLTFSTLSAGLYTTCGIAAGTTYCWGNNFDGQVGDNSTIDRPQPTAVSSGIAFQAVSAGSYHTCAIEATSGNAYCWGWNGYGQVGDGTAFEHTGPVAVSGLSARRVAAGVLHTCAAGTGGAAACWGLNSTGQLGDNSTSDRASPGGVSGLTTGIVEVGAGVGYSCALDEAGSAYCWGSNTFGQLGDGTTTGTLAPVKVASPVAFTSISTGYFHSCGVGQDGKIYCWGANGRGELGNGTTTNSSTPVAVASAETFKQVSAGWQLTCAVSTSGVAYCWGDNNAGGVGNGTTSTAPVTSPTPVQMPSGTSFASVSAGDGFACGVTTAGTGYCWGFNGNGQLGNNSTTSSAAPVEVSGKITWKSISTGRAHACGITSDDVLMCWGDNFTGQLGDGTFGDRSVPTRVLAATAFNRVAAGYVHTCGAFGSTIYCWGSDERGELGRGTATTIRKAPLQVIAGPASTPVLVRRLDAGARSVETRTSATLEPERTARLETEVRLKRRY
ncbi:hypothetical protein HRbin33_02148 [bacterium HR33]|nr:hypothetical protein HRbin33_02148 [bacterium HR33]